MSASLVGSEMCIRDSLSPARCCHLRRRRRYRDLPGRVWLGPRAPTAQPAVSYTHLTLPTICSV
eukprot:5904146-Alexandrium_andersonii.AAC.1